MTSTAYLNPAACRRRYEAVVDREETYPSAALEALSDRLCSAASAARGDVANALRDRAATLSVILWARERRAEQDRIADARERADCAAEDADDERREREWLGSR